MASLQGELSKVLTEDFEKWLEESTSESVFLLENKSNSDGGVCLLMLLAGEYEFKLHCPADYPCSDSIFHVETAEPAINGWAIALNEQLTDSGQGFKLQDVLNLGVSLHNSKESKNSVTESEDSEMEAEDEDGINVELENDGEIGMSDDEGIFTTEWELKVARKKKRWTQKEEELRESLKKAKLAVSVNKDKKKNLAHEASGEPATGVKVKINNCSENDGKNIFTSSAALGVLTNDLVKIMEHEESIGITAEPIQDNIYKWCVKLFKFDSHSELAKDLEEIHKQFGYKHIELQLDFTMDLYPFYPPIVKVIRPRLMGAMMQRVTNMEILKLSFWNPTKDMMSLLTNIKEFLQVWARLDCGSERNDRKKFPNGSYVEIEHHLLKLALVSEINPRANLKYHLDVEKPNFMSQSSKTNGKRKKQEFWAAGTGFGHSKRPEWDIKAYLAAQKEKDKQIESVLHSILFELKVLYANHAPQLRPKVKSEASSSTTKTSSISNVSSNSNVNSDSNKTDTADCKVMDCDLEASSSQHVASNEKNMSECIDPVEDMYNILEGSALVPFFEQYLKADSFLEICRHTVVYKAIVDIIREIALQNQLVTLLGLLPDQTTSVYQLLKVLEEKANIILQHICKAGNGHIPKPSPTEGKSLSGCKKGKAKVKTSSPAATTSVASTSASAGALPDTSPPPPKIVSSEEKLAREFQVLFRDVSEGFNRSGLEANPISEQNGNDDDAIEFLKTVDRDMVLEERYRKALTDLQFDTATINTEGSHSHKYSKEYQKQNALSQSQIFRIAQEVTSLATSLPLNLSSSIYVRTDDEKLTLMRVLITGPEGTPYYSGCFLFDVFFPPSYPTIPPKVNLQTTGGGQVRFNPNLYNCGKVCLSLLGTWEGQQGEQWNETTSTILQVLVSIQSLILVPEPYFNEPGYEQEIGTDAGKRHSAEYNSDVRINNIKHAMIAQLQNPCPGFEDVIKTHFFVKRERILQEVEKWLRTDYSSKLDKAYQNLKNELKKIELPENIANILQDMKVQNLTPVKEKSCDASGGDSCGSSSTTLKTDSSYSSSGSSQFTGGATQCSSTAEAKEESSSGSTSNTINTPAHETHLEGSQNNTQKVSTDVGIAKKFLSFFTTKKDSGAEVADSSSGDSEMDMGL